MLTFTQPVAPWNLQLLQKLVEAGSFSHPGANFVESAGGQRINLAVLDRPKRRALAAQLLTVPGQRVGRHLLDGDAVLINRQPTLHKPGIMAHLVRVLRMKSQQTIRMHYANCNTYVATLASVSLS